MDIFFIVVGITICLLLVLIFISPPQDKDVCDRLDTLIGLTNSIDKRLEREIKRKYNE